MPKIANTSLNGEEKYLVAIPDAAPVLIAVIESPSSLANKFPFFESNTRSAVILGVVGAGGIGLQLTERMKAQYWDQSLFIILLILIMVAIIDTISRIIRMKIINE